MLCATAPSYLVMEQIILTDLCSYNAFDSLVETKIPYRGLLFLCPMPVFRIFLFPYYSSSCGSEIIHLARPVRLFQAIFGHFAPFKECKKHCLTAAGDLNVIVKQLFSFIEKVLVFLQTEQNTKLITLPLTYGKYRSCLWNAGRRYCL